MPQASGFTDASLKYAAGRLPAASSHTLMKPTLQRSGKAIVALDHRLRARQQGPCLQHRPGLQARNADYPSTTLRPQAVRSPSIVACRCGESSSSATNGMLAGSKNSVRTHADGETRSSSTIFTSIGPAGLDNSLVILSCRHFPGRATQATQRTPLPHCSTSEPSAIKDAIRLQADCPHCLGGRHPH